MKTYKVEELFQDIPGDEGNVLFTFPPDLLNEMNLKEGDNVSFKSENGSIIISKVE